MIALLQTHLPLDRWFFLYGMALEKGRARLPRPLKEWLTPRSLPALIAALFVLVFSMGIMVNAQEDLPNCSGESVILSYPHYSRKGLIEKYTYRCGRPDRTCSLREYSAKGPVHVCSPFGL